jgi:anion-transporting  ArsA/GET3 family ATPase
VRPLVELLTRSRAFGAFAAAAPGLPELVTLGKIWTLAVALRDDGRAPVWDALIVDCPATGHGIGMLEAAANAEDLAGGGPIRDQASRIDEVIRHPAATGIALVARPQEMAVTEAIEAAQTLRAGGFPVAGAVLNGVRGPRFAPEDVPALEAASAADGPAGEAAAAALRHLEHQVFDEEYRDRLAEGAGVPVLELPELVRRRFDMAALETLADALPVPAASGNGRP